MCSDCVYSLMIGARRIGYSRSDGLLKEWYMCSDCVYSLMIGALIVFTL
jgi:hypothetical protein